MQKYMHTQKYIDAEIDAQNSNSYSRTVKLLHPNIGWECCYIYIYICIYISFFWSFNFYKQVWGMLLIPSCAPLMRRRNTWLPEEIHKYSKHRQSDEAAMPRRLSPRPSPSDRQSDEAARTNPTQTGVHHNSVNLQRNHCACAGFPNFSTAAT